MKNKIIFNILDLFYDIPIFYPNTLYMIIWKIIMLTFLLYHLLLYPLRLTFYHEEFEEMGIGMQLT